MDDSKIASQGYSEKYKIANGKSRRNKSPGRIFNNLNHSTKSIGYSEEDKIMDEIKILENSRTDKKLFHKIEANPRNR